MSVAHPLPLDLTADRETRTRADAAPAATTVDRSGRRYLWALLALTAFAAVLRFWRIDQPTFWIDEGFTYWRVSGSYKDLVDILQLDGFTPLHYEIYWVIGQFTSLSPFFMRLVPAVAGTLMVPAMYFLARQIGSRRLALLVAAFVACSAYMLNYSRDAKMYMHTWLFAALHLGCLLWWLRTRLTLAWLCWVAAGLAMGGTHATSLVLLSIQPVMLLTARGVKWTTTLLFLAGLALVAAGPAGYYVGFNRWNERIEDSGWDRASGLGWVDWFNAGRQGIDRLRYPATAYLANWEWTRANSEPKVNPRVLFWLKTGATAVLVLAAMGLFPWRVPRRVAPGDMVVNDPPSTAATEPWWRATLWILTWLTIPAFILFAVSAERPVSPAALLRDGLSYLDTPAEWVIAGALVLAAFACCGATSAQRVRKSLLLVAVVSGVIALCWGFATRFEFRNVGSVWVPRYLAVVWPAFAIGLCALLLRLPGWPLRAAAIMLVLGMNLAAGVARMTFATQPPLDRIAAEVVAGQDEAGPVRTFISANLIDRADAFGGGLLSPPGRYYLCQAAGQRVKPREFLVSNFDFRSDAFLRAIDLRFDVLTSPRNLARRVLSDGRLPERLIVWERFGALWPLPTAPAAQPPPMPSAADDPIRQALGDGWVRVSAADTPVYINFSWEWTYTARRREYVRAATSPTSQPTPETDAVAASRAQ